MVYTTKPSAETVGVIGAGPAGLITAHVLLQDGFDVQVLTRDRTAGGVWARERVYPGLYLNK
jgi:dimethylaniline monooxygenase (N-oxide forming)